MTPRHALFSRAITIRIQVNLSIDQKLIVLFVALSILLTILNPESITSALALALSSALFGLTLYLNRSRESHHEALEQKLRELGDKVQAIQMQTMQRGMGR